MWSNFFKQLNSSKLSKEQHAYVIELYQRESTPDPAMDFATYMLLLKSVKQNHITYVCGEGTVSSKLKRATR